MHELSYYAVGHDACIKGVRVLEKCNVGSCICEHVPKDKWIGLTEIALKKQKIYNVKY